MIELATGRDLLPILPEVVLTLTGAIAILVELFGFQKDKKTAVALVALLGLGASLFLEIQLFGHNYQGFFGMVVADNYSILFEIVYLVTAILTILISWHYLAENDMNFGEYYILLVFAVVGMMFMTSSLNLLVIFIGLEIMSISSYILVGMRRRLAEANEAALKYLLLGAFSTGFMLYGISLVYGATGSTSLPTIISQLQQSGGALNPLASVGLALMVIGVGFKVAVVPFHMWTPDVYTGAPTPVTAFLSAASKAAAFAMLIRIFLTGMPLDDPRWDHVMWLIAVLTMTVGNIMALQQKSVKRMLAYSSIAHAGYAMVAVVAGSPAAISSILFYSCAYAMMSIGAFGILAIRQNGKVIETYDDLAGYAKRSPLLAILMTTFMLSLLGLPLTAGFVGKYQIFIAALESGWPLLTVIAALNSAVSLYYYLLVVVYMYMKEPKQTEQMTETVPTHPPAPTVLAVTGLIGSAVIILYLGIFPGTLVELAHHSVQAILY